MTSFQAIDSTNKISIASLFAPCQQLLQSFVLPRAGIKTAADRNYLDLDAAAQLFGIEREILLAAIVDRQLPSAFSDSGYCIAYQDLEQFVDRYFYRKNIISGHYLPKFES